MCVVVYEHLGLTLVKISRSIGQFEIGSVGVVEDDLGDRLLYNRAAVGVAGDWQPGKGTIIPWRHEPFIFPTGKDQRIAAAHKQTGACICRSRRIVAAHFIKGAMPFVAAVHHVIENSLIPLRHVDGFDNVHIGRIFDHAARVARRQVDVGNQRVPAIGRIDFAISPGEDLFVGADGSKRQAPERRRLDTQNLQPNDARISRWRSADDCQSQGDQKHQVEL